MVTGWPANPNLVRHLKSTLIWTGVHVDEAVMGLSVHTDKDGGGDNPLLRHSSMDSFGVRSLGSAAAQGGQDTSTEAAHERVTLHRMGHGRPALQASRDASCQVEKSCRMTIRRRDPPNSHITTFFSYSQRLAFFINSQS